MDPLAQTFNVNVEDGSDGVFITKVDLYFKQKDSEKGITVQIRETDNGYPSSAILGQKFVDSSGISISDTALLPTTITFDTPIFVRAFKDYALSVVADGNSPEYFIWTSTPGIPDVTTPTLISNKDWSGGALFVSTNDKVWTPIKTEDLKFKLYNAVFSKTNGTLVLENDAYEFLTLANTEGAFRTQEQVAQRANTYLVSFLTGNTSSSVVNTATSIVGAVATGDHVLCVYSIANTAANAGTLDVADGTRTAEGSGTSFNTDYAVGDYVLINGNVREVSAVANATHMTLDAPLRSAVTANIHHGATEKFQINKVISSNTSSITFKDYLYYNVDANTIFMSAQKVVRGVVDTINNNDTIVLNYSSASNTTFLFEATKKIVGEESQAVATITSVDTIGVNFTEPHVSTFLPASTGIDLVEKIVGETATAANNDSVFGISNKTLYAAKINSKSTDIATGEKYKMYLNLNATSALNRLSPVVDLSPASIVTLKNIINNSSADETTNYGNAQVKYISQQIVLADGLDAEDMKVYLTAYKPIGSSIEVYAKVLSSDDSTTFDSKDWTLLNQDTEIGLYSDSLNESDFIEYGYSFKKTPPSTELTGLINASSNTTIVGIGTTFTSDLVANDVVKLVKTNTETDYDIAVVSTVSNNTLLTVASNVSFTASSIKIEKVTQPSAAFKYNKDSSIVNYIDSSHAIHSTYKVFAVKVVLLSSSSHNVPILNDVRAIAVSV